MNDCWRERIGEAGLVHLRRFRLWLLARAILCLLGFIAIVVLGLRPSSSGAGEWWAVGFTCFVATITSVFATRHSRWIEKDVAGRLSLGERGSWAIDLRSPAAFDESIHKSRAKALKRDQKRTSPPWWTP